MRLEQITRLFKQATESLPNDPVSELQQMLMWCRPGGSRTERRFIDQYIKPLGVNHDAMGNRIKRIGTAPVLWSVHTDTVHRAGGLQVVRRNGDELSVGSKSNCLGADDTTGVWLATNMIRRGVEGLYVFHREEESGATGSRFIADKTPDLLKGIDFAIALDRKGTRDVITHQFGRCCSGEFAASLAAELNKGGLGLQYKPDSSGMFTDTANYTDLVGECTNISVGYECQHTSHETQDGAHAAVLLDALSNLDWTKLEAKRKPGETYSRWDADDYGTGYGNITGDYNGSRHGSNVYRWDKKTGVLRHIHSTTAGKGLLNLVKMYPNATAALMEEWGLDEKDLSEYIDQAYGTN